MVRGGYPSGRSLCPAVDAICSDMAARKRKKPPPRRARRSLLSARPSLALPRLDLQPHHLDVIALALMAIGIFLAGVAYSHISGGALGDGAVRALRFLFGELGYAVPAGLAIGGALLLVREPRPPGPPIRAG